MTDRYYVSDEREHEYGYYRVCDREREQDPDYAGEGIYGREHVVAMSETLDDARAVREALANADAPEHDDEPASTRAGVVVGSRIAAAMEREHDGVATYRDRLVLAEYRKGIRS